MEYSQRLQTFVGQKSRRALILQVWRLSLKTMEKWLHNKGAHMICTPTVPFLSLHVIWVDNSMREVHKKKRFNWLQMLWRFCGKAWAGCQIDWEVLSSLLTFLIFLKMSWWLHHKIVVAGKKSLCFANRTWHYVLKLPYQLEEKNQKVIKSVNVTLFYFM